MRGRTPKPKHLRQRRNRSSAAVTLSVGPSTRQRAPSLPRCRDWHPMTRAWWHEVWYSPMASEFLQVDTHGLFRLAVLVDKFWANPTNGLAAEIRLEQTAYGLSPIDRHRLQWEVERVEKGKRHPMRKGESGDPRGYLRVVE